MYAWHHTMYAARRRNRKNEYRPFGIYCPRYYSSRDYGQRCEKSSDILNGHSESNDKVVARKRRVITRAGFKNGGGFLNSAAIPLLTDGMR